MDCSYKTRFWEEVVLDVTLEGSTLLLLNNKLINMAIPLFYFINEYVCTP